MFKYCVILLLLRGNRFFISNNSLLVCVSNLAVTSKHAEQRLFDWSMLCLVEFMKERNLFGTKELKESANLILVVSKKEIRIIIGKVENLFVTNISMSFLLIILILQGLITFLNTVLLWKSILVATSSLRKLFIISITYETIIALVILYCFLTTLPMLPFIILKSIKSDTKWNLPSCLLSDPMNH